MSKSFLEIGSNINFSWRARKDYREKQMSIHIYRDAVLPDNSNRFWLQRNVHRVSDNNNRGLPSSKFLCGLPGGQSLSITRDYCILSLSEVLEDSDLVCKKCLSSYLSCLSSCIFFSNRMEGWPDFIEERFTSFYKLKDIDFLENTASELKAYHDELLERYNNLKNVADASREVTVGSGRIKNLEIDI